MKKRFSKRSYKRRRVFKKKRFSKKRSYPKPDGLVSTKVHGQADIQFEAAIGAGTTFINWAGNGIPAGTQAMRLTVQSEFTRFAAIYQEYKVTGLQWNFIPLSNVNTAGDTGIYHLEFGSDVRAGLMVDTTTVAVLQQTADYKIVPGARPYKRFIRLSKFFKGQSGFQGWVSTAVNYPDTGTLIRYVGAGYANLSTFGRLYCTWYVKWRGIRTV